MKFGIYVRCNSANNFYHTLSFIALFLSVITFSVNIHLHSQLFHQEIDFWLIKNQVLRKDLLFLQIKSIEFKYRKLNNSSYANYLRIELYNAIKINFSDDVAWSR